MFKLFAPLCVKSSANLIEVDIDAFLKGTDTSFDRSARQSASPARPRDTAASVGARAASVRARAACFMIVDKPIEQMACADLERVVSNGVAESRTLEYSVPTWETSIRRTMKKRPQRTADDASR